MYKEMLRAGDPKYYVRVDFPKATESVCVCLGRADVPDVQQPGTVKPPGEKDNPVKNQRLVCSSVCICLK